MICNRLFENAKIQKVDLCTVKNYTSGITKFLTSVFPFLQCWNVIAITNATTLILSQLLSLPSPVNSTVSVVAVDTAAKRHYL